MSRSPGRTQADRRATSEAALLRAAAEVIAEEGVERASLRSISARAGSSHVMPTYHFGSKEALIALIATRGHQLTMAAATAAVGQAEHELDELPKLEALRVIIETFLKQFTSSDAVEERAVVVMWGASFPAHSALPAMDESDLQTHRYLTELIRAGQADRSIREDVDVDAASQFVIGMARGVAAMSFNHPDIADGNSLTKLVGDAILATLASTQAKA